MGIHDRVRVFLENWPMVKQQLEEVTTTATVAVPEGDESEENGKDDF